MLINEGVHAKTISERLGHADVQITINTYGQALQQADEIATNKLDDAISNLENLAYAKPLQYALVALMQ